MDSKWTSQERAWTGEAVRAAMLLQQSNPQDADARWPATSTENGTSCSIELTGTAVSPGSKSK